MRTAAITIFAIAVLAAGCGGGSKHAATAPQLSTSATSSQIASQAALTRAVRAALTENFRLSVYVLWHNRIPTWAQHSTQGPALAALRTSATTRQKRGIHIRSAQGRYTIVSVRLDPSYTHASALVRDKGRVFPYRGDKRLGRAIAVDDRARIELRRVGDAVRFVVWRVRPVQ